MSVHVSSTVWKMALPSTDKLVMLALADIANDEGDAWPSNRLLVERTGLSERAIQGALSRLEQAGHLSREMRAGRSTVYRVLPQQPPQQMHPAADAPRSRCTPRGAPRAPTPAARAPITIKEPSVNRQRVAVELPDWLPADAWKDWGDFRKSGKGWTSKAQALSLRTLASLHEQGHDPRAVIEQSIERGWTGLFPLKAKPTAGAPSDQWAGAL